MARLRPMLGLGRVTLTDDAGRPHRAVLVTVAWARWASPTRIDRATHRALARPFSRDPVFWALLVPFGLALAAPSLGAAALASACGVGRLVLAFRGLGGAARVAAVMGLYAALLGMGLALAQLTAVRLVGVYYRRRFPPVALGLGRCPACLYDLTSNLAQEDGPDLVCPECGAVWSRARAKPSRPARPPPGETPGRRRDSPASSPGAILSWRPVLTPASAPRRSR